MQSVASGSFFLFLSPMLQMFFSQLYISLTPVGPSLTPTRYVRAQCGGVMRCYQREYPFTAVPGCTGAEWRDVGACHRRTQVRGRVSHLPRRGRLRHHHRSGGNDQHRHRHAQSLYGGFAAKVGEGHRMWQRPGLHRPEHGLQGDLQHDPIDVLLGLRGQPHDAAVLRDCAVEGHRYGRPN